MASTSREVGSPKQHHMGEHWSGANPVPTVQNFIEHLDKDKKERDQRIDEEVKHRNEAIKKEQLEDSKGEVHEGKHGDVMTHQPRRVSKEKMRTVTDPTTGKEIGVEDQDESSMETVRNPKVRISISIKWQCRDDSLTWV